MKKLLIFLFLPLLAFGQATTAYHRVGQVLARAPLGSVNAQVVPFATVVVSYTSSGAAASIFSDPGLSVGIANSTLNADSEGNYDYYFALNVCVTETIMSPNGGITSIPNICANVGGGCPAIPCTIAEGGTSATTVTGAFANIVAPGGTISGALNSSYVGNDTFAGSITSPSIITPSVSKGIVLYSSASCAVNSNINSGGGTDDSVCLQGLLNRISAAGGGTLVQDGVSLISAASVPGTSIGQTTSLKMGANTTLTCSGTGSGFYLANNSNVTMLGNNISGSVAFSNLQQNIAVDGCTFNANGANQSRYELGNTNNEWVFGLWFGGFDGLRLNNVSVYNARTFAILLSWGQTFFINNTSVVQLAGVGAGGNNHDGLHFWGTVKDGHVNNFLDANGDDDGLAFNTDEGYTNYLGLVASGGWQPNRCPNSNLDGDIDNVTVDNVYLLNVNDPLRFFGTGDGVQTVSNIFLHNIYGNTSGGAICCGNNVTVSGGLSIDGWYVAGGGGNALPTPPNAAPLQLSNIIPSATVSIGSGSSGPLLLSPTLLTLNTGILSALNSNWRSTALAVLSLSDAGDLYLGFDQPDIWLRAGSQSAVNLNSVSGSGYTASLILPSTTRFVGQGIVQSANNIFDDGSGNASFSKTFRLTSSTKPSSSAGSVANFSTNNGMVITGLSSATTVTITFNPAWVNYAFCSANPSVSLTTAPYITSMSNTAATFTFSSLTGSLFVTCVGN